MLSRSPTPTASKCSRPSTHSASRRSCLGGSGEPASGSVSGGGCKTSWMRPRGKVCGTSHCRMHSPAPHVLTTPCTVAVDAAERKSEEATVRATSLQREADDLRVLLHQSRAALDADLVTAKPSLADSYHGAMPREFLGLRPYAGAGPAHYSGRDDPSRHAPFPATSAAHPTGRAPHDGSATAPSAAVAPAPAAPAATSTWPAPRAATWDTPGRAVPVAVPGGYTPHRVASVPPPAPAAAPSHAVLPPALPPHPRAPVVRPPATSASGAGSGAGAGAGTSAGVGTSVGAGAPAATAAGNGHLGYPPQRQQDDAQPGVLALALQDLAVPHSGGDGQGCDDDAAVAQLVLGASAPNSRRSSDQAARDQAARDQAAKDEADRVAREQAARYQAAWDQAARDQAARDQAAKDEADRVAREQAAKDEADRAAQAKADAQRQADALARIEAEEEEERLRAEREAAEKALAARRAARAAKERAAKAKAQQNAGSPQYDPYSTYTPSWDNTGDNTDGATSPEPDNDSKQPEPIVAVTNPDLKSYMYVPSPHDHALVCLTVTTTTTTTRERAREHREARGDEGLRPLSPAAETADEPGFSSGDEGAFGGSDLSAGSLGYVPWLVPLSRS